MRAMPEGQCRPRVAEIGDRAMKVAHPTLAPALLAMVLHAPDDAPISSYEPDRL